MTNNEKLILAYKDNEYKEIERLLSPTRFLFFTLPPKVDVNLVLDSHRFTPLHWIAVDGNKKIAKFLIAKGADVNAVDIDGCTPLHCAVYSNHEKDAEDGERLSMRMGYVDLGENGTTPYWATVEGHTEIAKLLIASGADVNAVNNEGETPLFLAASNNCKEIAKLLISNGADVNSVEGRGYTPLHWASAGGYTEIVKLLISNGANVNTVGNADTPLSMAKWAEQNEIVEILIAKGAEENAVDEDSNP